MGFFKDRKSEDNDAAVFKFNSNDDVMVNTLDSSDQSEEISKLDGLLQKVEEKTKDNNAKEINSEDTEMKMIVPEGPADMSAHVDMEKVSEPKNENISTITSGMKITGDVESDGSINLDGTVTGNVKCGGKIIIRGSVHGDISCAELYADNAKAEGEIKSDGTVKVGDGTVIIGNISATSAVIAGAVKGDIDVQGTVIVDSSAVVKGNIKSRSVQINNGAFVDGFCSQAYSDVDLESVFNDADEK